MSAYRKRARDIAHMMAVKGLRCVAAHLSECSGPIEADHAGRRPLGRKADDDTCIPLCQLHHRQRTDFSGVFRSWNQKMMREFLEAAIKSTRRLLAPST